MLSGPCLRSLLKSLILAKSFLAQPVSDEGGYVLDSHVIPPSSRYFGTTFGIIDECSIGPLPDDPTVLEHRHLAGSLEGPAARLHGRPAQCGFSADKVRVARLPFRILTVVVSERS